MEKIESRVQQGWVSEKSEVLLKKIELERLMNLKADNSQGLNDIYTRILKEVALELLDVLVIIFQLPIGSTIIPVDWKRQMQCHYLR